MLCVRNTVEKLHRDFLKSKIDGCFPCGGTMERRGAAFFQMPWVRFSFPFYFKGHLFNGRASLDFPFVTSQDYALQIGKEYRNTHVQLLLLIEKMFPAKGKWTTGAIPSTAQ